MCEHIPAALVFVHIYNMYACYVHCNLDVCVKKGERGRVYVHDVMLGYDLIKLFLACKNKSISREMYSTQ